MLKNAISRFSKVLAVLALVFGAQLASADVSGSWTFAVDIAGQGGNATVTMSQDDDKITGHYAGQLGNTDFTGSATGNDFQFVLVGDAGSVTYKGTLQADGTIKGTLDLAGMAEGTFIGTKS